MGKPIATTISFIRLKDSRTVVLDGKLQCRVKLLELVAGGAWVEITTPIPKKPKA